MKRNKKTYRKSLSVNEAKATSGAFGKPIWTRTEEQLVKRKKKDNVIIIDKQSFFDKIKGFFNVVDDGRK